VLDAFHHGTVDSYPSVITIMAESKQLQEFQDLFELYVSDYLTLQRCSEELLYLKSLWDMVGPYHTDMQAVAKLGRQLLAVMPCCVYELSATDSSNVYASFKQHMWTPLLIMAYGGLHL
jgi:hypothetical protein